jgi:hypothetical protein
MFPVFFLLLHLIYPVCTVKYLCEKFKETNGVIRSRESKDKQQKCQKYKNIIYKTLHEN